MYVVKTICFLSNVAIEIAAQKSFFISFDSPVCVVKFCLRIHCSFCDSVTHCKCAEISDSSFKEFQNASGFLWSCDSCQDQVETVKSCKKLSDLADDIKKIQDCNSTINAQIKDIKARVHERTTDGKMSILQDNLSKSFAEALKNMVAKNNDILVNKMEALQVDLKKSYSDALKVNLSKSFADALKGMVDKNNDDLVGKMNSFQEDLKKSYSDVLKGVVVDNVVNANDKMVNINDGIQLLKIELLVTKDTIKSLSEAEERSCNIIIFKLKESNDQSFSDGKRQDVERIAHILQTIINDKIDKSSIIKLKARQEIG
ncbi:hypothetical protein HELRODRAFT_165411 [Helobdella robusta]|uniref:Zinc finger PHD-type domain-containing protein n=1 Tax=Helobdella robusta TaxID=6412 RepID=T1EWQ9_HELRO|nr:hypothetical protein HELRODRAFT_165411 [Helobdella robusta]ESN91382.1 hypothetical protein HELRODRAFT_165411 [Helobdella robusta]